MRKEAESFRDKFLWRKLTLLLIVEVEFSAEFIMKFNIQNFSKVPLTVNGPERETSVKCHR